MVKKTLLKKIKRDLLDIKLQVLTISLVTGLGVSVLIGMTSTYDSLKRAQSFFYKISNYPDFFITLKRTPHYILNELMENEDIAQAQSRLEFDGLLELPEFPEMASAHLISIPDGQQPLQSQLYLKQGRLPSSQTLNEAVISEGLFLAHQLKLGTTVYVMMNGRKTELTLVGVATSPEQIIALPPGNPMPDDMHFAILWVNQTLLEQRFDMNGAFNRVTFIGRKNNSDSQIKDKIESSLSKFGILNIHGRDLQASHVYVTEELKQLQVQATILPIIFFLVSAYILNVVIGRLIHVQRSEIATLKALGFSDYEISTYYIFISLVIVTLGNLIGVILGYLIGHSMTQLYTVYYHFPVLQYQLNFQHLLLSISITALVSILSLLNSLRGIFKLSPAEAMRPPSPPSFSNINFEKSLYFHSFSTKTKMLIRGIFSFPRKSTLNILGLSLTIVLLVSGLFWPDSMDFLVYAQYGLVQKETGQIQLTQSLPSQTINEVLRIPGIIEAEGYRSESVEVTFENTKKKTILRGFPSAPKLSGIVNEKLDEIPIPQEGIFITRILARQLKIKEGDLLQVQFLDGRKEGFSLKIEKIVDSLLTSELITNRDTLSRLLKQDDQINSILFHSIGSPLIIYNSLKERPQVLAVQFKENILKVFEETSAQYLIVFAGILSVFAAAIGFGVAYNNLQISLNERDWELATLQILGFKMSELFQILSSEILVFVLISVPVGWAGGWLLSKWLISKMSMDAMQIPFIMSSSIFIYSASILIFSTLLGSGVIYLKLKKLNMIETLKTRG